MTVSRELLERNLSSLSQGRESRKGKTCGKRRYSTMNTGQAWRKRIAVCRKKAILSKSQKALWCALKFSVYAALQSTVPSSEGTLLKNLVW